MTFPVHLCLASFAAKMSEDFSHYTRDGVSIIRFHRQVAIDRLLEIIEAVLPEVSDRRLWNVAHHFDFSPADIKRLSEVGRTLWTGPARVAYVSDHAASYGMLRMFEAYRYQEGYVTKAFLDEPSALEWLHVDPEGPPHRAKT